MQYIGVEIDDESFNKIQNIEINFVEIMDYLWEHTSKDQYPWLWGIDSYGYTVFNIHQIGYLSEELNRLQSMVKNNDTLRGQIISFSDTIIREMKQHLYLKFIGD
jgi:hypothetical protein